MSVAAQAWRRRIQALPGGAERLEVRLDRRGASVVCRRMKNNASEGTRAVIRAFQILECLTHEIKGLRITDLTRLTGLHKATVFRMLNTLIGMGYVTKSPESDYYKPTLKILSVSNRLLSRYELRSIAAADIQRLADDSGQAVHLSVPDADETVIVEKVEVHSPFRLAFHIGRRAAMYSTGTGKVFLAHMPQDELEAYMARVPLEPLTPSTVRDREQLTRELAKVRRVGYAVDQEEATPGVGCVAAPIMDFSGRVAAAVSVTGAVAAIVGSVAQITPLVTATAENISHKLGYQSL
ncbi:MAG: IclR family transcriptional regulator [Desulfovibrio sp.]|nr:IclR family transcriptional regulator [Desulfovibrio sp.]